MTDFSKRFGVGEEHHLQINTTNARLKIVLWNVVDSVLKEISSRGYFYDGDIRPIAMKFAINIDSFPINIMGEHTADDNISFLKRIILGDKRYVIYDFIELLLKSSRLEVNNKSNYISCFNMMLEQENSGYRLDQNGIFIAITNEQELKAVNKAQNTKYDTVNTHIQQASYLLSNKKKPDYRNSIKEAISAVECIVNIINGTDSDSLGKALKKLEKTGISIPQILQEGFEKLYGYTSNKQSGIRHHLTEKSVEVSFEEAQFMLISCSAFVNYLIAKNEKVLSKNS